MKQHFTTKQILLACFSFAMVSTMSFLLVKNMYTTDATMNGFKAGNIISDYVMSNYNTMNESQIQAFLNSKNSCNKGVSGGGYIGAGNDYGVTFNYGATYGSKYYHYHANNNKYICIGNERFDGQSAAHIIYRAAQDYHINPQVLLVLLQKEQSLITDQWPNTNFQYRSATGYGCPDTAPCNSEYYGFKNQVRKAAELFRIVLDNDYNPYHSGRTAYVQYNPNASCGGSNVYIENRATAALYRYTPYQPGGSGNCAAYGNRNFYDYFTDWFGDTRTSVPFNANKLTNLFIEEGDYYIFTNDGKALDVTGAYSDNGTNVEIWDTNYGNAQKFHISRTSDGFYKITNVASGKALDVTGALPYSDINVEIWSSNTSCAQKWVIGETNGHYTFRNVCGGKALEVTNGAINTAGANVRVYNYNGKSGQQWNLKNVNATAPVQDGVYSLLDFKGKALDVYGGYTTNGTNIEIWDNHDGNAQEFQITRLEDGLYRIKNTRSNKSLDVTGASNKSGVNVELWSGNTTCAQKWVISKTNDGYFTLRNACGGKALDVYEDRTSARGTNVEVFYYHGGTAQKWQLTSPKQNSFTNGVYRILTTKNKALNTTSESIGANINIDNTNNSDFQKFTLSRTSDGYFMIKNTKTNKFVDVTGASKKHDINVEIWSGNTTCAQKWFITYAPDGYYYINNLCGGHTLDINGNHPEIPGTNVRVYAHNNTSAQHWKIEK